MLAARIPVLIVGGGAAGSMLQLEMARRGVAARCIDRLTAPATTSRAITVHARMAEIFQCIDPELWQRYAARAITANGYVLHFVDDAGQRSVVRPGLDFTTLKSEHRCLYVHGQHDTEQTLRRYTREKYDVGVQWGVELVSVSKHEDYVRASLRHADGREEEVEADYLVACDGKNSRVRRGLQLVQDESDYSGSVMQNLDVYLHDFPDVDDHVHYCVGRGHFLMLAKLPGGYHRLLLSDRGEAAAPSLQPEVAFQRLIDQHFNGVSMGETVWHSKWESWVRLSHTYRSGRVFLAGDSAHVHSTSGGQGMNCCMQDAFNLGWKLAMVLQGSARESLLDSYEAERKPIAEQVIWAASSLHSIFMGHGKSIAERTALISDPAYLQKVVGHCSGIDYSYRAACGGNVSSMPDGLQAGDRVPNLALPDGTRLYDHLSRSGFSLLYEADAAGGEVQQGSTLRGLCAQYPSLVAAVALRSVLPDFMSGIALIRPDGYLAARATTADTRPLAQYLETTLGN
jgi:2-polyprenyl-6-methoxyphenol hydroxylase-like FAD-dependent oxidoreductase